jgi:hypothetical protein
LAAELRAQPPGVPTTVQLPTVSVFSVQTTVWAPDRGAAWLGGGETASDQRWLRGPWPAVGRAVSSTRTAHAASVHATIIDHAALDHALLEEAARNGIRPSPASREVDAQAQWLTRHVGRPDPRPEAPQSVAEALAASAQQAQAKEQQAAHFLAAGKKALAAGHPGAARVYFQMASRSTSSPVREEATMLLETLSPRHASK